MSDNQPSIRQITSLLKLMREFNVETLSLGSLHISKAPDAPMQAFKEMPPASDPNPKSPQHKFKEPNKTQTEMLDELIKFDLGE